MLGMYRRLVLLSPVFVATAACNSVPTATNMYMSKMDASRQTAGSHITHMIDNAILRDMSVADIHFIPHTGELSGIGEARLNRMATLLDTYGGTVRYETLEDDEALIEQRLGHVREYLELTGCNMGRVEVAAMMSGGRGLPGDEAVEKYTQGTAQKSEDQSGSLALSPAMLAP
ncbi:MAG: hypothetical protein WBE26_08550 [Phycisphaerae bacterium]